MRAQERFGFAPPTIRPSLPPLRPWQQEAIAEYQRCDPRDFLAVATPGAGKTTFALTIAEQLLAEGAVRSVTVVCPTEHLKVQWTAAARARGIILDPTFTNRAGRLSRDYDGAVVTYAQVGLAPLVHRARVEASPSLVIFDEIHHAGDALTWGDGLREAFAPATRRLALTGTPFRSDTNPIPFVNYETDGEGVPRSRADYVYGYAEALRAGVVRPVIFLAYSGEAKWRTSAGVEMSATIGQPLNAEQTAHAWRTILDPAGDWISAVFAAADKRLTQVREGGMRDAGGLVIASDHASARAYAMMLGRECGEKPVVVLSDDPAASRKIAEFSQSKQRWMVAVRMVSEGVDIPRLAVGVFATTVSTPLFFAQAVGRFVRMRRRGETASMFLPSVPILLQHAAELEVARDHVLRQREEDGEQFDDQLLEIARRDAAASDVLDQVGWVPLDASAHLDRVIFDGADYGTAAYVGSEEEQDFLGLPGLLAPEQVAALLRDRQAKQIAQRTRDAKSRARQAESPMREPEPLMTHEVVANLRRELQLMVGAEHHRTGRPHAVINAELRRLCGGPPAAQATMKQLEQRIALLRKWATS